MSSALVWELVKNYNCFMKSNLNGTLLSAEAGNLYNKHTYKFSGALHGRCGACSQSSRGRQRGGKHDAKATCMIWPAVS